jgi:hypothetical protein
MNDHMKRIILPVFVMAFAVAVQAGDAKTSQAKDQDQPACCGGKMKTSTQVKMKTSTEVKEGTSSTAKGCCGCCKQQASAKQTVLLSPKAADAVN